MQPRLDSNVRPRMHAYLAAICRDLRAGVVCVGGVADHVHIINTVANFFLSGIHQIAAEARINFDERYV